MIKFIGTAQNEKESLLYYYQTRDQFNFFKMVASYDGFTFLDKAKYVIVTNEQHKEEKNFNWEGFRITKQHDIYLLTYKVVSNKTTQLYGALSTDMLHWKKFGVIEEINETSTVVPNYKHKEHYALYYGEKEIKIAYSGDLRHWKADEQAIIKPRKSHFDHGNLEVGNAYLLDDNILLTYYVKTGSAQKPHYSVGAILFDKKNPAKPVWRSEEPLWEQPQDFEGKSIKPIGSAIVNNELLFYWLFGETTVLAVSCQIPTKHTGLRKKAFSLMLKKHPKNPIIAPNPKNAWESRATFNSAAVYEDGKVHFLYRSLGDTDLSVLGYATSKDGITIDERLDMPIYIPREPFETPGQKSFTSLAEHFVSGGGYGGVEDPRITRVEDKLYLTYVAFDGANPPRAAMSWINVDDFLARKWDKWSKPKLISAPGMVNKSAVIFPDKVNGKYVALHRIYPNILVDYLDNLEFDDYLQGHYFIPPRKSHWDSKKVGAGAPPIMTKDGWLLIYQSVGYQDPGRYKIGAMLLDKDRPEKVLYRSDHPLIEPIEPYENNGFKAGVVYPCGAVAMDNKLHVYYGGADSYVNVASTELDRFLYDIKHNQDPKLKRVRSPLFN